MKTWSAGHSWLMSQFMSRSRVIIQYNISPLQRSPKWDRAHTYSGAHEAWKHFLPVTFCPCETDTKPRRTGNVYREARIQRLSLHIAGFHFYRLLNHYASTRWRAVTVEWFSATSLFLETDQSLRRQSSLMTCVRETCLRPDVSVNNSHHWRQYESLRRPVR